MAYRTVGNTVVEWDDNAPFIFTMAEQTDSSSDRPAASITIDLVGLREGFEDTFLMHLREHLMERCNRVALKSIATEAKNLRSLFANVIELAIFDAKIGVVDETFLLCLASVKEKLNTSHLRFLRIAFRANPISPLFAKGLQPGDFPQKKFKKGVHGSQIDRILGKALSQAAVARILDLCDTAYATGKIDIGHYSFACLAFAVFCRPESYRQIRVGDLHYEGRTNQYFIMIVTSKTGEHRPNKVNFCINESLGVLLTKQRQHVVATYGHLVASEEILKLALFPARQLKCNGSSWKHDYANQFWGMCKDAAQFNNSYAYALKKKIDADAFTLGANALRHTVGTLLAQTGASAKTIQAVLKHASDVVCKAYVDIAFHGMIEELSTAMRPAFENHLPALLNFRAKGDPMHAEQIIWSEDMETGRIEETGGCGKKIACENAPIVCYSCFRFHPCWDADHSINLAKAQKEIDEMSMRGKAWEHMVRRARTAKNRIIIIMHAADRYREAKQQGTPV